MAISLCPGTELTIFEKWGVPESRVPAIWATEKFPVVKGGGNKVTLCVASHKCHLRHAYINRHLEFSYLYDLSSVCFSETCPVLFVHFLRDEKTRSLIRKVVKAYLHDEIFLKFWDDFWSNYSDLTRPHPKWWFSKGNPLISGKSRSVKYYNLAR